MIGNCSGINVALVRFPGVVKIAPAEPGQVVVPSAEVGSCGRRRSPREIGLQRVGEAVDGRRVSAVSGDPHWGERTPALPAVVAFAEP